MRSKTKITPSPLPKGWSDDRIKSVIHHYEAQTEDEALAEDDAARASKGGTYMFVPRGMIAEVRRLLAATQKRKRPAARTAPGKVRKKPATSTTSK